MTKDLQETLDELGAPYAAVVDRLKRSAELSPRRTAEIPRRAVWRPVLKAASALLGLGLAAWWLAPSRAVRPTNEYSLAHSGRAEDLAEIIRTQRADGGWANDYLTRQNAAALKVSTRPEAQIAFKKAARNLRLRGCL